VANEAFNTVPAPQPTSTPLLDHLRIHGRTNNKSRTKGESSSSVAPRAAVGSAANESAGKTNIGKSKNTTNASKNDPSSQTGGGPKKGKAKKKHRTESQGSNDGQAVPKSKGPLLQASAFPSLPSQITALPTGRQSPVSPRQSGPAHQGLLNLEAQPPNRVNTLLSSKVSETKSVPLANNGQQRGNRGRGRGSGLGTETTRPGRQLNASDDSSPPAPVQQDGRSKGAGRGSGQERTAQGAIVQILSRNANAGRGRGRGGNQLAAAGAASESRGPLNPNEARIDM